jgi:hypothetical protein
MRSANRDGVGPNCPKSLAPSEWGCVQLSYLIVSQGAVINQVRTSLLANDANESDAGCCREVLATPLDSDSLARRRNERISQPAV